MGVDVDRVLGGCWHVWHGVGMLDKLLAAAILADEAHGGGEDDAATLPRLDGARGKRLA